MEDSKKSFNEWAEKMAQITDKDPDFLNKSGQMKVLEYLCEKYGFTSWSY